jgi:hypothetical protein
VAVPDCDHRGYSRRDVNRVRHLDNSSTIMKINVAVTIHWLAMILGLVISIATIVAGNSTDVKLAGGAATVLAIAQLLKKRVDKLDNEAAVKTAVSAVAPAIVAATTDNLTQASAVKNTLAAIPET